MRVHRRRDENHIGSQFGQGGAELAVFMSSQLLQVTPHIVGLVVLMSSQVLQATSHIVGLVALCTGTRTLFHQKKNSFTFNLCERFSSHRGRVQTDQHS